MMTVHNFSYGLLTPALAYAISCLGCFLGLRCTTRAREVQGPARVRWLLLAAVSVGVAGVWGMHFVAMLGFTIPGQTIRYSVPVTIFSMVIAVVVVSVGLLIVGFGGDGLRPLLTGGLIVGLGVASMHYIGMAAMRMPDTMHYSIGLVHPLGDHRRRHRDRRAAGRAAAGYGVVGLCRVPDHGRGRQRDALHGHGGHAHVPAAAGQRHGRQCRAAPAQRPSWCRSSSASRILTMVVTAAISLSPTKAELRRENEAIARIAGQYDGNLAWAPGWPGQLSS